MKSKAQIEIKENKMSTNNNEVKVARTFDGAQKAFPMFMTWIEEILVYKGITHMTKATFKNLSPESENASRQSADQ